MANFKSPYFALDGGLNYKAVLNHFQDQSKGVQKINLIHSNRDSNGSNRKQKSRNSLVLLDLADPEKPKDSKQQPKIEVIDPTEAERKRALGQLEMEATEIGQVKKAKKISKARNPAPNGHSTQSNRPRQTKKRQATAQKIVNQKVKRAKDIFD